MAVLLGRHFYLRLMKKLILSILLFSLPAHALTIERRDKSDVVTLSQVSLTDANASDVVSGPYESAGFHCVWASASGSPVYKLQSSNDNTNWVDVSSASTTVSGAAGSGMWFVSPLPARYARIYVGTTSTAGTVDCIGVMQR